MALILLVPLFILVFVILPIGWQGFLGSERGQELLRWRLYYVSAWRTVTLGPCRSGGKQVSGRMVERRLATHWDKLDRIVGVGRMWDYKLPEEEDDGEWWKVYERRE